MVTERKKKKNNEKKLLSGDERKKNKKRNCYVVIEKNIKGTANNKKVTAIGKGTVKVIVA